MKSKVKTYQITKSLNTHFKNEFCNSKNPRYIRVLGCKAIYQDVLVGDICVHADFVCRDADFDSFICFANEQRTIFKKYEYTSSKRDFNIWFTDIKGKKIDVEDFVLELLLIY